MKFIATFIVGNNERLRFLILQKQCWSRWALILLLYNFLDSVSMVFNIHNVISSLIILLPLLIWRPSHLVNGLASFLVGWLLCSAFSFDKDILASFFYFGYSIKEAEKVQGDSCNSEMRNYFSQETPFWMMILISVAAVPLSTSLNNILKRRNLPPLLSPYCLLKIVQIIVLTNTNFVGFSVEEETIASGLSPEQPGLNIFKEKPNIENKTFNFGLMFTNFSLGDQDGGADKIFSSIFQSPSFTFHDTSLLTNIFISAGVLLFSPYMYIYR